MDSLVIDICLQMLNMTVEDSTSWMRHPDVICQHFLIHFLLLADQNVNKPLLVARPFNFGVLPFGARLSGHVCQ